MLTRLTFLKSILAIPFANTFSQIKKKSSRKLILEERDLLEQNLEEVIKAVNFTNPNNLYKLHYINGVQTKIINLKLKIFVLRIWEKKAFSFCFYSEQNPLIVLDIDSNDDFRRVLVYSPNRILPFLIQNTSLLLLR